MGPKGRLRGASKKGETRIKYNGKGGDASQFGGTGERHGAGQVCENVPKSKKGWKKSGSSIMQKEREKGQRKGGRGGRVGVKTLSNELKRKKWFWTNGQGNLREGGVKREKI